ncbi:hypothetical protein [Nocardia higoensis]|nr:hypothetical protein [Nocardia higoensis]
MGSAIIGLGSAVLDLGSVVVGDVIDLVVGVLEGIAEALGSADAA